MIDENDEASPSATDRQKSPAREEPERRPGWRRDASRPRTDSTKGDAPLRRKAASHAQAPEKSAFEGERIAKAIARSGHGSRRDAEAWIAQGRITVNGRVLQTPALNVVDTDEIAIDGKPLMRKERTRLWLFHKPRGFMTTESDPEGRQTIFDALPADLPRVVAVGRLDFNTEGLMLLTNDGGLARVLELPSTGWLRRYRVRANGEIEQSTLDTLAGGMTVDGVSYAGIEATLDREQGANVWLTLGLREGKNREVKRVLEHLGLAVNRLIRLSFGPFQLGELAPGEAAEIRTRVLRDQLGEALAREAGADFDAPLRERVEPSLPKRSPGRRVESRSFSGPAKPAPAPHDEPRTRKHVSALRAERDGDQRNGPRKRIERAATADRHGREIAVERIRPASAKADSSSRNGRRFAAQRTGGSDEGARAPKAGLRPRTAHRQKDSANTRRQRGPHSEGQRSREMGGPDRGESRGRDVKRPRPAAEAGERRTGSRPASRDDGRRQRDAGRPNDLERRHRPDRHRPDSERKRDPSSRPPSRGGPAGREEFRRDRGAARPEPANRGRRPDEEKRREPSSRPPSRSGPGQPRGAGDREGRRPSRPSPDRGPKRRDGEKPGGRPGRPPRKR